MTSIGQLAGRVLSLLVFVLAAGACDRADPTEPSTGTNPAAIPVGSAFSPALAFSSTFRGGIPFGTSAQPTEEFGELFNGALRNIWPQYLLENLARIKARGGKVVLMFAGTDRHYKDSFGFNLSAWKDRIDRFRAVDFSSYINDGTIVGHFLVDEPNDPKNWNGHQISPATVEEMARYSKQIWPNLPTIVRVEPAYLGTNHRYLDGAWAQYVSRKGSPDEYAHRNIADARARGLALVVGLNISKGGPDQRELTADEVRSWGSALLAEDYSCAFISWQYDQTWLNKAGMTQALATLAERARQRSSRSCRGADALAGSPDPDEPPTPEPSVPVEQPAPGETGGIQLEAHGPYTVGDRSYLLLTWSGAAGSSVDLYREGRFRRNTENDGRTKIVIDPSRRTSYLVQVCEQGSSRCSSQISVRIPQ